MFSFVISKIERISWNSSSTHQKYENKFHNMADVDGIFVDLMKIFAQYEKINYILCDGRSAQ